MTKIKIEDLKNRLKNNFGVRYREIECDEGTIYIVYIDDLCDKKFISEYIVAPLIKNLKLCSNIEQIKKNILMSSFVEYALSLDDAVAQILSANTIVLFDFLEKALWCDTKGFTKRNIDIPITETVIKGPREGFNEVLVDNLSAIRRRIKSPNLKVEQLIVGLESNTLAVMIYIDGSAPQKLIDYVRNGINNLNKKLKNGFVFDSNIISEELCKSSSPFDTVGYTEKPDIACSKLSEGRVIVLVDGDPFAVTAPYFFIENFQSSDDYNLNKYMGNMGRILRWISFIISTFAPGMYLALVTYHFRLIPTTYLFRMAIFRAGVPVPTIVELLYMTLFFQIIREAGVRLPQPIGPTLSIVGALILGDAAVRSGLSSQVTVVVVAISSITSYLLPKMHAALFIWNLIFIAFSGFLGLPGFFMSFVVFIAHLSGLTTCNYPYLYPLGTMKKFKYNDVISRGSLSKISSKIFMEDKSNENN